jgi:hypothetical protein
MNRRGITRGSLFLTVLAVSALAGCGAPTGAGGVAPPTPDAGSQPPSIESFTASSNSALVGDRAQLTAVFTGSSASIEGLGPVQSGQPVDTPPLAATSQFTLTVRGAGQEVQASLTIEVNYRDRIRQLDDAPVARSGHLAMALPGGTALLMGGYSSESPSVPDSETTELFDAATEKVSSGPTLAFSALDRSYTIAIPLRTGFLLAGGGINSGTVLQTRSQLLSQTFDSTQEMFARAGDLQAGAAGNGDSAATLLADGRVLMTGGGITGSPSTEVFDPGTRQWTPGAELVVGRRGHTATLLQDGRVLIVGGVVCCSGGSFTTAAELYDPSTGNSRTTGSLGAARLLHQATLLRDGRVLVSGGFGRRDASGMQVELGTEIYNPTTGEFSPAGVLQVARALHSQVLLGDGRVLVVGGVAVNATDDAGIPVTELFDPQANRWTVGPTLDPAWTRATATLLTTGRVLLFGGESLDGSPKPTALLYE